MRVVVAGDADEIMPLIRERMRQENVSQRVLADHLGFSYKHMSQVITGKCGTPLSTIFLICEYLDMGIALMPGKGSSA
jgi:transcriptional regulator with XRE-family HTH domain